MNQNQKRLALIGGAVAVVALIGVAVIPSLLEKKPDVWTRPSLAKVDYITRSGDDLNKIALQHGGVPTLTLATANDRRLRTGFQKNCGSDRVWPLKGSDYCNLRLNLGWASTLRPEQALRIPDRSASALPTDIQNAAGRIPSTERVAILVDAVGGAAIKQDGLDAAVQWNLALYNQRKPLATVWVYTREGLVEYRHEATLWPFGRKHTPFQNAVRMLDSGAFDRIVLVTNAWMSEQDVSGAAVATPIVGYCLTSDCQPGMTRLTSLISDQLKQKGASYAVPHTS